MKSIREKIEVAADVVRTFCEMIGWSEPWMISQAEMRIFGIEQAAYLALKF